MIIIEPSTRYALKENRRHGSDPFPLAAYWIDYEHNDAPVLDIHWHSEAEFFVVLEGEVLFQVDTDSFRVRTGEAVYIDGGELHAGHSVDGSSCSFAAIVFDTNLLASPSYDAIQEKFIAPLQDKTRTFPRHIRFGSEWERSLLDHLHAILDLCAGEGEGYEAAVKGRLYLMLHTIAGAGVRSNRSEATGADSARIERLKAVISYMHDNYGRPIRISELAELIPMSEGQFCRFFKKMTRQTPIEYLNAYRIRQASRQLLQDGSKIANVAMDAGFEHISYFVKVFRSVMGCTPSEFRRKRVQHYDE